MQHEYTEDEVDFIPYVLSKCIRSESQFALAIAPEDWEARKCASVTYKKQVDLNYRRPEIEWSRLYTYESADRWFFRMKVV